MPKCDYLIVAGGTGGHVFPALSVALDLIYIGYRVCWLGQSGSLEEKVAAEYKIKFIVQASPSWYGGSFLKKAFIFMPLFISIYNMWFELKQLNPKVIVGFGGHITVPVGLCAWLQRRKLLIQEQNLIPGKANKLLSIFADKVMTGYKDTFFNKKNAIYTGNPLRRDILAAGKKLPPKTSDLASPMKVLILGGSGGSAAMNHIIADAFDNIGQDFKIWHQTGKKNKDEIGERYAISDKDAYVESFIDDMARAYEWADVVISRAGALTISELLAFSKPSILIPNPRCANNHQLYNALYLVDQGVASCTLEDTPNVSTEIAGKLMYWFANPQEYYKVCGAAKSLARFDAVDRVVSLCISAHDGSDYVKASD